MTTLAAISARRAQPLESATLVAVVAALSATTMLFASLVSAYLVRRSFADWRPSPALWPVVLLSFAFAASAGVEVAARFEGSRRRRGLAGLALASGLYLAAALGVIVSVAAGPGGLESPFKAFVALLLSVHAIHAVLGGGFAVWILREQGGGSPESALLLARLVTHFLTALLCAIVFLLFGLQ